MSSTETGPPPRWCATGDPRFPYAGRVDGVWWVVRLNAFPDHPLWTLFVDGVARADHDTAPASWGPWPDAEAVTPDAREVHAALAAVRRYAAHGSETGRPCTAPHCCG